MKKPKLKSDRRFITFKPGNRIHYRQDFVNHIGIPAGVQFEVVSVDQKHAVLVAPGYGDTNDYGNGGIYIYRRMNVK